MLNKIKRLILAVFFAKEIKVIQEMAFQYNENWPSNCDKATAAWYEGQRSAASKIFYILRLG